MASRSVILPKQFNPDFAITNKQPVGKLAIDFSNRFAKDLIFASVGTDPFVNIVNQDTASDIDGIAILRDDGGQYSRPTNATRKFIEWDNSSLYDCTDTRGVTYIGLCKFDGTCNFPALIGKG